MQIHIVALFAGKPRLTPAQGSEAWWDKPWESAIFKEPVTGPVWLAYGGLHGDAQADRVHHGGPDKAVCAYPAAHYAYWRAQPELAAMANGGFGENLTLDGATETEFCIGDRFQLGKAVLEISQPRQPCWKLARRWRVLDLKTQSEQTGFTGFYFRVLRHGFIQAGDTGKLLERHWPQWTIAECNQIMHHRPKDHEAALRLAECPHLSGAWKDQLYARANQGNK